jgi:hypothetical protein
MRRWALVVVVITAFVVAPFAGQAQQLRRTVPSIILSPA